MMILEQPSAQEKAVRDRLLDLSGQVMHLLMDHTEVRADLPDRFEMQIFSFQDADVSEYAQRLHQAKLKRSRLPRVSVVIDLGAIAFYTGRHLKRVGVIWLDQAEAKGPPPVGLRALEAVLDTA